MNLAHSFPSQPSTHPLRALPPKNQTDQPAVVLVVDDDPSEREIFALWLQREGYQVHLAESAEDCIAQLPTLLPDLVCMDVRMPGMGGIGGLEHLQRTHPLLPVLMLTASEDVEVAVSAMRSGAYDYMQKPVERQRFLTQVRNAAERSRIGLRLAQLEREAEAQAEGYPGIVGNSPAMQRLFRELDRVAPSDVTALVHGESGSGKELIAHAIHQNSGYREGPFVALNCASIPEALQESEMFGHEKGAFTGADQRRQGRFEEADGGTLFLDEVAELSLSLQAKLLRVLQERSFRRVGGSADLESQFRLVAASHKDLQAEVQAGRFREDLFYRLAVFELHVPALRQREGDVLQLSHCFLQQFAQANGQPALNLSASAAQALSGYAWPGNVRELQNALQRAHVVARKGEIQVDDLPPRILQQVDGQVEVTKLDAAAPTSAITAPTSQASLEDIEKQAILTAIDSTDGNLSEVARVLNIGRTTLYRKLKKYGLK